LEGEKKDTYFHKNFYQVKLQKQKYIISKNVKDKL